MYILLNHRPPGHDMIRAYLENAHFQTGPSAPSPPGIVITIMPVKFHKSLLGRNDFQVCHVEHCSDHRIHDHGQKTQHRMGSRYYEYVPVC